MRKTDLQIRKAEAAKVDSEYNPHRLFDYLKARFNLKSDRALADAIDSTPPQISKARSGTNGYAVSDDLILKIHESTDISIKKIKWLMYE